MGNISAVLALLEKGCDVDFIREDPVGNPVRHTNHSTHKPAKSQIVVFSEDFCLRSHVLFSVIKMQNIIFYAPQTGQPALLNAVVRRDMAMVTLLLKHEASVNLTDELGFSPLMHAAESGVMDMVTLLLDNGANVNAVGNVTSWSTFEYISDMWILFWLVGWCKEMKQTNYHVFFQISSVMLYV